MKTWGQIYNLFPEEVGGSSRRNPFGNGPALRPPDHLSFLPPFLRPVLERGGVLKHERAEHGPLKTEQNHALAQEACLPGLVGRFLPRIFQNRPTGRVFGLVLKMTKTAGLVPISAHHWVKVITPD